MQPEQRIFITNTMRSGSSLLINALCTHSKIMILSDNIHFFRFMYKRYEPLKEKNVHRMLLSERTRMYYRFGVEMETELVLEKIKEKGFTYSVIYDEIMKYYLGKTGKTIWGEAPAMNWREIPVFLSFFPKAKVIHPFRDPRAIMTSWKKSSGLPNRGYLNSLFNWIDSVNHVEKFSTILPKENYFPIKYEELVNEPEKWMRKICEFIGVDYEDILMQPEKWKTVIVDKVLMPIARSSHDGLVLGYSPERANRWRDVIEPWELALVESLAKKQLLQRGYELIGKNLASDDFALALEHIKQNDILRKHLCIYLSTGEGVQEYPMDPTDYRSWGYRDKSVGRTGWFADSPKAKEYLEKMQAINEQFGR